MEDPVSNLKNVRNKIKYASEDVSMSNEQATTPGVERTRRITCTTTIGHCSSNPPSDKGTLSRPAKWLAFVLEERFDERQVTDPIAAVSPKGRGSAALDGVELLITSQRQLHIEGKGVTISIRSYTLTIMSRLELIGFRLTRFKLLIRISIRIWTGIA
jgi:hypothetical protein